MKTIVHGNKIKKIRTNHGTIFAENIINGDQGITTGASNDIERATEIARNMVTKWGFSDKLGTLKYDDEDENPFLGRSAGAKKRIFSEETAKLIDDEVRSIIHTCYEKAGSILAANLDKLHNMSDALLKYETIDQDQISDIMAGALPRDKSDDNDQDTPKKSIYLLIAEDSKIPGRSLLPKAINLSVAPAQRIARFV